MKERIIILCIFVCTCSIKARAQYSNAYSGSAGDGQSSIEIVAQELDFSKGTISGGYTSIHLSNETLSFSFASDGDGYVQSIYNGNSLPAYFSSDGDGQMSFSLFGSSLQSNLGSIGDGYSLSQSCRTITWTGMLGTGWNVADNWQDQLIPCHCNGVIIPDQAISFPFVNSGVLRVGGTDDSADYNCKQIKIEFGAQMTTRINCFVENYRQIIVKGILEVKNVTPTAFLNFGQIDVNGSGLLRFNP